MSDAGQTPPLTYFRVHTETRQESGPDYVASIGPDPLWGCTTCGAVITQDSWPLHDRWHAAGSTATERGRQMSADDRPLGEASALSPQVPIYDEHPEHGRLFVGFQPRECGEHRTVGDYRAWCYDCGEWCYPKAPCVRCEARSVTGLLDKLAALDVPEDALRPVREWIEANR